MRWPFPEWQQGFGQLVDNVQLRNEFARDAKQCHEELAHEEAAALLTMTEAAEGEAKRLVEELT